MPELLPYQEMCIRDRHRPLLPNKISPVKYERSREVGERSGERSGRRSNFEPVIIGD